MQIVAMPQSRSLLAAFAASPPLIRGGEGRIKSPSITKTRIGSSMKARQCPKAAHLSGAIKTAINVATSQAIIGHIQRRKKVLLRKDVRLCSLNLMISQPINDKSTKISSKVVGNGPILNLTTYNGRMIGNKNNQIFDT